MSVRILLLLGFAVFGCFVAFFAHRFTASYLQIHVQPPFVWKSALIESSNLKTPQLFQSNSDIKVSPLEHGQYTVLIQFSDGRVVCFDFVHTDAGDSRWLDFDITPSASPAAVHVHAAVNKWLLRRHLTEFDGDIRFDTTSHDSPLRIFGP